MNNASGTALWKLGAVLISVAVAAVIYFLLISPELEKTATAKSGIDSARQLNDLLDTQILAAQTAAKNVDEWKAEIAAIRLDLPPTPEQVELEELLKASMTKEGLPALSISYGTPSELVAPAPPTTAGTNTAADATTTTTPSPAADPNSVTDPTGEAAEGADTEVPVTGLYQTPVTISTAGKPAALMRFLLDMQTQNSRFFTVSDFNVSRATATEAASGKPALEAGDWVVSITGSVYNLFDPELSLPPLEPGTTPPYTGNDVANPFAPIPGTEAAANS